MKNLTTNFKKNLLIISFVLVSFVSISIVGVRYFNVKHLNKNQNYSSTNFSNEFLQPSIEKVQIIEKILNHKKIQDKNILGILLHSKHWTGSTVSEANEIKELMSFVDMYFSNHIEQLRLEAQKDLELKSSLAQLEALDRKISKL